MPLSRRPLPFDHPEWMFELKYDGFRALAVIQNGRTQLISRNGHPFSFDLRVPLHAGKTVLDGEIVCVDEQGKPQFHDLLFHRGEPCFFAFDLLMADGKDVRPEKLTDRKQELRRLLAGMIPCLDSVTQTTSRAKGLRYSNVCAKWTLRACSQARLRPYTTEQTTWFKIKNRHYSQMQGREELFERERHKEPVAGWHCCELACAEVENA